MFLVSAYTFFVAELSAHEWRPHYEHSRTYSLHLSLSLILSIMSTRAVYYRADSDRSVGGRAHLSVRFTTGRESRSKGISLFVSERRSGKGFEISFPFQHRRRGCPRLDLNWFKKLLILCPSSTTWQMRLWPISPRPIGYCTTVTYKDCPAISRRCSPCLVWQI